MDTQTAFDNVDLARLRRRRSEKWSSYPADVLPAFVAEMDFDLAPPVKLALQDAIDLGDCGYAGGFAELANAFAHFASHRFNWTVEENRILTVPDVMAGVTESLSVLTQPGAGVVINPPVYPPFFEAIRNAGRTVVEVPLQGDPQSGWLFDFESIERAFAAGAQAFLLCNPHNPLGRVWTEEELRRIATLAQAYKVAVISDEVHAPLTMPGIDYVPFQRVASEDQKCTSIASASKAWNVAGLKCAIIVAVNDEVRHNLRQYAREHRTEIRDRVGLLGIIANIAAFREGGAWLDALRAYLDGNRQHLAQLLQEHIPATRYRPPDASYLAWVDCSELVLDTSAAQYFLTHGRVALQSGTPFGKPGEHYVRINMGTSRAILEEIVHRMAAALR